MCRGGGNAGDALCRAQTKRPLDRLSHVHRRRIVAIAALMCLAPLGLLAYLAVTLPSGMVTHSNDDSLRRTVILIDLLVGVVLIAGVCLLDYLLLQSEQLEDEIRRSARTDALTGLPNRRAWDEVLPRELARARRDRRPFIVAMVDLDHFKRFNDARGHQAGDSLLGAVARAWGKVVRDSDFIARYGGEEFALALPDCELPEALEVAERIRAAVTSGQTCSVGLAQWTRRESAEALMARADRALYEAKRAGRDRVCGSPDKPLARA